MERLYVHRVSYQTPIFVGAIDAERRLFSYAPSYLEDPQALRLSRSLPLRMDPFPETDYRPYFEGLLAEGDARRALVSELEVAEDDYLALLSACGRDCIGDVMVSGERLAKGIRLDGSYHPISSNDFRQLFLKDLSIASENASSRLSLAGTQHKTGLAHEPEGDLADGWLRPHGIAATTHILKTSDLRDIPEIEFLCMSAAAACGIRCARVRLLDEGRPVLVVQRFDRVAQLVDGRLHVERLHQEDLAQAFSVTPASKYAELSGGTVRSIARMIRRESTRPVADLSHIAQMLVFSYVVGNCDNHLKNYSLVYGEESGGRAATSLAPLYDVVCTTRYPRFSRNMGMAIGGVRDIDAIGPENLTGLARELGLAPRVFKGLIEPIVGQCEEAIMKAGEGAYGSVLESTPYISEDLIEDMAPRLKVLKSYVIS